MEDALYGYAPNQTVADQIQAQAKAREALKATNPDLGGAQKLPRPFPATNGAVQAAKPGANVPRKLFILPKTPESNSDQNQRKLERQLNQRQEAHEKEQAWTKRQIERLTTERLKLEEEEKRLEEAKKRWNIPTPPLDPIPSPTSQAEEEDDSDHFQEMHQRIQDNLKKIKTEFNKDPQMKTGLHRSSNKPTYETTQAVQYYMIRDILVDVINQAVDKSLDKAKTKKKQDITLLLLAAAEKEYDSSQKFQSRERAIQLISEEIFLETTSEMTVEVIQEWLGIEDYVRVSTQTLIVNSAEAVATNQRSGRETDDPAYDLITATYFHMCKERRRKRAAMWKHTQTVHFIDPDSQNIMSGVISDMDVTKLTMSHLTPVHLWPKDKVSPWLKFYFRREKEFWQPERITLQPSILRLAKRVGGVMTATVSPTQRLLALGTVKGDVLVFDLWYDSSNPVRYIRNEGASPDGIIQISWSLDGRRLTILNESGSVFMWSLHPGGSNPKDSKNLDFKDDSEDIVPSQLTLLLALDPEAEDFDFQEGPLARSQAQTDARNPVTTAFHPSHTLLGSQNCLMVGFESGDIIKCNVEQQISGTSEQFENIENVKYPMIQDSRNEIGQEIPVELFRAHKYKIVFIGFVGNYGNMVSVDDKGHIFIWKYTRRKISHYGWFEPVGKYWLEMADTIYETISNKTPEIYFSDDYILEKKKMKGKNKDRLRAELEADRQAAEDEWIDINMKQLWYKDENKKQDTVTRVYKPDTVDAKGSPFHIIMRQKTTGLLLKHYSQLHKPVPLFASRLLECHPTATGRELVFMLLFPPSPPKAAHLAFIVLKMEDQPETQDMRIDVSLSDEEYDSCFKDDVCSFQVSNVLDAPGSSYLYLMLLGSLLVFSLNTGHLVLSSNKKDTRAPIQWVPRSPSKLWTRSMVTLANTRGSTLIILYAENQTTVQVLQLTDRNTKEKRMAVNKAFKFWNRTHKGPVVEQTIRRREWSLDGDAAGHLGLFVARLVLELADEAVQKVDGEFSEETAKKHKKDDRRFAQKYFADRIQGSREVEPSTPDENEMDVEGQDDQANAPGNELSPQSQDGDDLNNDEVEDHPTV